MIKIKQNKEKSRNYRTEWNRLHPEAKRKQDKKYHKKHPWVRTLGYIRRRCNNPKCKDYKYYGLRGIKCLITKEELKYLWFRDKAYEMKKPSIDRKENNGDYELSNCQYMELTKNSEKRGKQHARL